MLSVVIPTRNEVFLNKTILDVLEKAESEIEVIPILEGYWPDDLVNDPRVNYLHHSQAKGMRTAINNGVAMARGKYIMKLDGHCMLDQGFDVKLLEHIEPNWIVIPRRKRLDAENWKIQDVGKPDVDYEYIEHPNYKGIKGQVWTQRILERQDPKYDIDENMTFQGSCWVMHRTHYTDFLGGMNPYGYGQFVREAQEIGLKTWLGGGRVMINKKTWYAHLHKGKKYGRGYFMNAKENDKGNKYCDDFWMNNKWEGRTHDLEFLIERFWPVPTWPNDRSQW